MIKNNQLSLSSKAKTLELLKPLIFKAKILPVFRFTVEEYSANKTKLINQISEEFESNLIVRSSSKNEDNEKTSNAGGFDSVMNVDSKDANSLQDSIDRVVTSYGDSVTNEDEVFVQSMLENVEMAGVVFSSDIDTLSDYYIVNYDESGSTDSVTSGQSNKLQTFISFKGNNNYKDERLKAVVDATKECENIFKTNYLDIEFAFSNSELYILQVRSIVTKSKNNLSDIDLKESLEKILLKFNNLNKKHPNLLGDKAVFGVMPDWNPAEIVGLRPKRLALSLYKELITDETWAHQRKNYGYRDLTSHPLLVSFLGVPYVDVRVSFNSFIPKDLDEGIANKLVNYYLTRLANNKTHHDKVEFEIVFSCYYFGIEKRLNDLLQYDFSDDEVVQIRNSLLDLTKNIIHPSHGLYKQDLNKVKILKEKFENIVNSDLALVDKIYWLIKDVKRYGTLPFAGAARAGFIAVQFFKSFVDEGIITESEYNLFLKTLNTVSKSLVRDKSVLNKQDFIDKYGHLRPGAYDILSQNYEQNYDKYFTNQVEENVEESVFVFSKAQRQKIQERLEKYGLNVSFEQFIIFIKEAIEGRESIKFEFSKSLNKILEYIFEFGQQLKYDKFNREELANLDIQILISLYSTLDHRHATDILRSNIVKNQNFHRFTQAVKLPSVITNPEDIFSFVIDEYTANFITLKSITASVVCEENTRGQDNVDLNNKIICIKSADPGYDYLFSRGIGGLITCYGGANSHMAIRCSELGIPAVIGCGEREFSTYNRASLIELDASNRKVKVLR